MNILHFGSSGVTAARFLKQWSSHRHELVSVSGEGLNEATVSENFVASLVDEADVLHFHEPLEYPHNIDWITYAAGKRKIFHSYRSLLTPEGKWRVPDDSRKAEGFDAYWGTHLGMDDVYPGLKFAPEFVPVNDWLLQPGPEERPAVFFSCGGIRRQRELRKQGISMDVGYKTPESTLALRFHYLGVLDNYWTGCWGRFGIEAMAQGLPVVVHVADRNRECLRVLKAKDDPPFVECGYKGDNLADAFRKILNMPQEERLGISRFGRWWAREWYDPERITWLWDGLYEGLK
jgi:hypothetical protein